MPYRYRWILPVMLILLALLVSACGGTPPAEVSSETAEAQIEAAAETAQAVAESAEPLAETAQAVGAEGLETAQSLAGTAVTTGAEGMETAEAVMATVVTTATVISGDVGEPVADLGGRTLIVGSDTTYPPMEFVNDQREIVGFDVDMMNAIAELINAEVQFETFPNFDAIFAALANGEFDLVVSSVTITEERDELIDFSQPYLSIGQVISVQESNTSITSVDDLLAEGIIVGVQGGTTGEQAAIGAGVPDDQIQRYDTIDLAFQDLSTGAIDAVIADGPPSAQYTAEIAGLKSVGGPFTTEEYGIAIQQGDTELQEAINAALDQLKEDGTLQQLLEKWNLQDVATLP